MADEVLELIKDLRAPTPGRFNREFASAFSALFGQIVNQDPLSNSGYTEVIPFPEKDLKKLSKFFAENPEDIKKLQSLIKQTRANRPSTSIVPLFENEAIDLEMPEKGVVKGKTGWTASRGYRPANKAFRRVGFTNTPFIDIDFPSPSHGTLGAVTASGLKEGLTDLLRYQRDFRKKGFNPTGSVYLTPAGMHYIEEGFKMNPRDFNRLGSPSDPFYKAFSERPLIVEGARNPLSLKNLKGVKDVELNELFKLIKEESDVYPSNRAGLNLKRRALGILPPMFNARTGPKYKPSGLIRVEPSNSRRGKTADFIKTKIGRLGEGTPLDSSLRASSIHDQDVREALEEIYEDYSKGGKEAMDVSRTRALKEAKDLPKDLKRKLGITPASLAKAAKGGIPLLLLSLLLPMLLGGGSQEQAA